MTNFLKKIKFVAGIDYSLTSPAVCVAKIIDNEIKFENCKFHFLKQNKSHKSLSKIFAYDYPEYTDDIDRFSKLASWTIECIRWFDVGAWVWNNFDSISGISFLPFSEHTYRQAPYQDCTKKEYDELLVKIPKKVDWSTLSNYEQQDYTIASQELACSAEGGCEIVDL